MVLALLLNSAGFSSKKRNAYFQYDDSSALKLLLRQEDSRHGSRGGLRWYSGKSPATLVIHRLFPAVEVVGSNPAPPIQ